MSKYLETKDFVSMQEDGLEKVVRGVTDLEELMRVVDLTDRF